MSRWLDALRGAPRASEPGAGEAGPAGAETAAIDRDAIVQALIGHLRAVWRSANRADVDAAIDPAVDLYESGYLDSLNASQFLLAAEKQFGVPLPDWLLGGGANSLHMVADHIERERSRARA
ncbi:MAG: acyl carrier protein [Acidobacteria bacterium]|nr:acyl carrier protein [Acidobacteriota bacterium]